VAGVEAQPKGNPKDHTKSARRCIPGNPEINSEIPKLISGKNKIGKSIGMFYGK
jgi:hypothetical protein